ncbi:nucleotidyltransferase domain-containing protein [Cohnella abietis]|uniref:Uncharacterized protein n=1 Tax=Cohnella abietis TaxID=2507935 RepID=A0A3T1D517_9BACL|nr:hypothetical protein [Cohnella abietis]BBI33187.1 hypothetical protein KCTCHS21_25860 [Cohnella abietis]
MQIDFPDSALARLAARLENYEDRWVVGGSTGLALRGAVLEQAPRDLDIYADYNSVPVIHERLSDYAMDGPEDNKTERYHSILSHYRLASTVVELVGNFRITARQSLYVTEVNDILFPNSDKVEVDGYLIPIVPLGHELIFNLLRERKDRAIVAGQLISRELDKHMPILQALIDRNVLASDIVYEAMQMVQSGIDFSQISQQEPL